jgi:nucleotide-binding universal stress UspA family protein
VGKATTDGHHTEEAGKTTAPVVKFLQRHGIEAKVVRKMVSKVGTAGELIAKAAEVGKSDLVTMGSRGHSALGNLVMGPVATRVLAHCWVRVLLAR